MRRQLLVAIAAALVAAAACGAEAEHSAVLEVGAAQEWELGGGAPRYGPNLAVEVEPIEQIDPEPVPADGAGASVSEPLRQPAYGAGCGCGASNLARRRVIAGWCGLDGTGPMPFAS